MRRDFSLDEGFPSHGEIVDGRVFSGPAKGILDDDRLRVFGRRASQPP
jgi:hypothetical protein